MWADRVASASSAEVDSRVTRSSATKPKPLEKKLSISFCGNENLSLSASSAWMKVSTSVMAANDEPLGICLVSDQSSPISAVASLGMVWFSIKSLVMQVMRLSLTHLMVTGSALTR